MKNLKINYYHNDIPESLISNDDIAIDTEAMGLKIARDRLCLLQFSFGDGEAHLVKFNGSDYSSPNLIKLLSIKESCKIFHFARFDLAIIKYYLGVELSNIFCTKIASKIARTYTDQHGLKELCRELLDINISKQQQSSFWGAEELSEDQKAYAASDVLYLHLLRDKLSSMLINEKRLHLAQECFSFLPSRIKLDIGGWDGDIFEH